MLIRNSSEKISLHQFFKCNNKKADKIFCPLNAQNFYRESVSLKQPCE